MVPKASTIDTGVCRPLWTAADPTRMDSVAPAMSPMSVVVDELATATK